VAGLLLGRMSHVQSGRPGRECADDGAWIGTQLREFWGPRQLNAQRRNILPVQANAGQSDRGSGPMGFLVWAGKRRDGFTSVTSPPFIMPAIGSASSSSRARIGYPCSE